VVALLGVVAGCGGDGGADATPTTSKERKVTVAGDSISLGLGTELRTMAPKGTMVKAIGVVGTGLARPDRFDWPARLRTLAKDFPPQVLVFSVGSNDAQDLTDAHGKTVARMADHDAWDAEYSRRLAAAFDAFEHSGTRVVWVGHVRTADERVGAMNRHVHELATDVAATRPWVTVTDLEQLLGIGDAPATACLRTDGLHLTTACLRRADEALLHQLPG
jgi:hypothetical protein